MDRIITKYALNPGGRGNLYAYGGTPHVVQTATLASTPRGVSVSRWARLGRGNGRARLPADLLREHSREKPPLRRGLVRPISVGRFRCRTCAPMIRNNRPAAKARAPRRLFLPLVYLWSPDTTRGTDLLRWLVIPDLIYIAV